MSGRIWRTAFGIALIMHLMILSALGYALREARNEEIQYIEVTTDELFAEEPDFQPQGEGQRPSSNQDNNTLMPKVEDPLKPAENVTAEPQKNAEQVIATPTFAESSLSTSTGNVASGSTTGGGEGTGNIGSGKVGSGHGTGRGSKQIPRILSDSEPDYPVEASANGWAGKVYVRVLISKTGWVKEVSLAESSGYECFDQSAIRWLHGVQFSIPYDDNGRPVNMDITVPVRFKLKSK
jgi:TonB family protein